MNQEKLHQTVRYAVGLLEQEAYVELENLSQEVRLSAEEMKEAIRSYGRKVAPFPEAGYKELDVIEINGAIPRQWSVNVPLFTVSEGLSDLTLSITVIETNAPLYKIEIDDIHVL